MVVSQHVTPGGVAEPLQVAVQVDVLDARRAGQEPGEPAVSAVSRHTEPLQCGVRLPVRVSPSQQAVGLGVQVGRALVVPVVEGEGGELRAPPGYYVVTVNDGPEGGNYRL